MRLFLFLVLTCILMCGCSTIATKSPPDTADEKKLSKEDKRFSEVPVQMLIENIPKSAWIKPPEDESTLFLSFFLFDKGEFFGDIKDIISIRVYDDTGYLWHPSFVVENGFTGGWMRLRTPKTFLNRNIFGLDKYTIAIQAGYRNGPAFTKVFSPTKVLSSDTLIYHSLVSEDYIGPIDEHFLRTLPRPVLSTATISENIFRIDFKITDQRARTGRIYFFDRDKRYIGTYLPFNDIDNAGIPRWAIGENLLLTDGTTNSYSIPLDRIFYSAGYTEGDIQFASIVLSSGFIGVVGSPIDQVVFQATSETEKVERK